MKIVSIDDQYKKFSSLKREDVAHLLDWINKQAHLPESVTGKKNIDLLIINKFRFKLQNWR